MIRTTTALLGLLAAATLITACGSDGSTAGESQFTHVAPAPTAEIDGTRTPPPMPYEEEEILPPADDPTDGVYPLEIQVYISMAQGLVDSGTLPTEAVTAEGIKEDISREYGITIDDETAEAIREEILP